MPRSAPANGPLSVLLIEDDLVEARRFEQHLRESSKEFHLRKDQSLSEALDALRMTSPDVVVVDPGLLGSEGVETVTEAAPALPVVVLSGPEDRGDGGAAEGAGAAQHLRRDELTPELAARTLKWAVERRHMRDKISRRDAWAQSVTESIAGAVYRSTPDGGIEYANGSFLDLFGYESLEPLRGTPLQALYADPTERTRLGEIENEDGELDEAEVLFRRADESTFIGLLSRHVVRDEDGQPLYYGGTISDVTDRARVEQELEETKARYESFIEEVLYGSPIGIFVLDSDFEVVWLNEAIEEYFGLDRDRVIGTEKRRLVEASMKEVFERPDHFAETVEAAYDENSYVERFECHVQPGPDRTERWLQYWSRPIEHGRFEGGRVEIFADVTERKEAEQALVEERDRFATLFHNLPTPVVHGYQGTDGRLRVHAVNEAFEAVFGHEPQDIRGADIQQLLLPDDSEAEAEAEVMRRRLIEGTNIERELQREAADGLRDFQVQVAFRGNENEGGPTEGYGIYTDITERKQRERRLQETTERLEAIIDASPVALVALDLEGNIELWNPAAECIFGWEEEEVVGGPPPYVPDEKEEEYRAHRQRVHAGEVINGARIRRRARDGTSIDLHLSAAPLYDPDGGVSGVMAALEDITDRKQSERERRRAERRYQAIFEDPNILVAHLDTDGTVLGINQTALKYIDMPPAEIKGTPFWETPWFDGDPEGQQKVQQWIDRAAAGEYFEFDIDHSDSVGRPLIVSGAFRPVTNENDEVSSLLISGRDVTGRRQLEGRLRDRGRKVESLYETTSHLLVSENAEEVATRIEEVLRSTFDYALNGVRFVRGGVLVPATVSPSLAERASELPAPSLDGGSLGARVLRAGRTMVVDDLSELDNDMEYGALKSGACVPIGEQGVITIASTQIDGVVPFDVKLVEMLAAYAFIVLDRIKHEEQLRAAKEGAEEASHLKSAMLANMSHEIRTPLTSIIGFSEVLTEHLEGELGEFADKSLRSSRRLMKTLDSVLQLSKLEAGAYALEREPVRLGRVVEETVELLRAGAEEGSVSVETSLSERPVEGHWNESGIIRIAENLVENAIKFTPEGGTVAVRVWREEAEGVLEVEDTGIGISEAVLPQVFEAFKQESAGLEREYEGTGLGLSVVRRLVEEHGGTIDVETEKGTGTCFTVRLPLSGDEALESGAD